MFINFRTLTGKTWFIFQLSPPLNNNNNSENRKKKNLKKISPRPRETGFNMDPAKE